MAGKAKGLTKEFEGLVADSSARHYVLRLFVTGTSARSTRAISNVKKICEAYLRGRYQLDVIDLYQQPQLAKMQQIIAAPTLVRELPLPVRRVLGDMSKTEQVLVVLGLQPKQTVETTPDP